MDLITITLLLSTCVILGLGFAVILKSREKLNRLYFLNILTIIGWAVAIMYFRLSSPVSLMLWTRLLYASATLIASNFLYFTYVFPAYSPVSWAKKALIFLPNAVLIGFCLFGNALLTGATINPTGENIIHWGPLYILYVLYILFYFNLAFFRLARKFSKSKDKTERTQILFVLLGYVSSGFISFATNLILPSFGVFALNWVGQVSTVLMAISAAYAIIKHRLFEAKVIVTELFVFALWIILLLRFLISSSAEDLIVNGAVFLLIFSVGILLLRSVIKEVETRERIEILAKSLQAANGRLRELDTQKTEFISFATHQLRAPLTAMKGYASLILENELGKVPKKAYDAVGRIYDSAKTMVTIVDDYLNVSRIELGTMKYSLEPIDLKALVEEVAQELRPNIEKAGLALTIGTKGDGPWTVSADPDKMKQIVSNVIDNAVKYTPKGSIAVTLEQGKPAIGGKEGAAAKPMIRYVVSDTGIGIAPEVMPKLFQKFSRAEGANKQNIHGTGLGLFIVKELAQGQGGKVWAESPGEGKGSRFIVELPAA